ncbi:MAG: hypothetical protein PUB46_08550 [Lachnospiraceae bacterium]|nr:hypothetical protein [Lachnospiraceae bacterium]MDD6170112.1 hypothetical protein [Lachnospiraceae bacterium]MDY4838591.1 hypothetical protein [Lachnospiraceae bacterium]
MGFWDNLKEDFQKKANRKVEEIRKRYEELAREASDSVLQRTRGEFIKNGNQVGLEVVEKEMDRRGIRY